MATPLTDADIDATICTPDGIVVGPIVRVEDDVVRRPPRRFRSSREPRNRGASTRHLLVETPDRRR